MKRHWASERGRQSDWAGIGFLKTQSQPRLCAYLALASFCSWEGGQLVGKGKSGAKYIYGRQYSIYV